MYSCCCHHPYILFSSPSSLSHQSPYPYLHSLLSSLRFSALWFYCCCCCCCCCCCFIHSVIYLIIIIIIMMETSTAPYLLKILQPKARTKAIQTTITSHNTHTYAHTHTHTHTRARARARAHTHIHTLTHIII